VTRYVSQGGSRTAPTTLLYSLLLLIFAACAPIVPATTPPQLQHTPGAPITISETRLDGGAFQVAYPAGWRVVKGNPAGEPLRATFVSPDETMLIFISVDSQADFTPPDNHRAVSTQLIDLPDGGSVAIAGSAAPESWARFETLFEKVAASLRT